jgi:sister-chromatid-cohesion protein PDS5
MIPNLSSQAASYIENTKRKLPAGIFPYSFSVITSLLKTPSKALRLEILELLFIRLLHFLAHYPDFSTTQEELMDMAR